MKIGDPRYCFDRREGSPLWIRALVREGPLEKGMAPHSSVLAWRIPWTEHYQLKNVVWGTQGPPWNPAPRHGHTVAREPVCGVPGSWRPLDSLLYV